jgi:MFS transporter, SP family, arabinose:H+ symporter
VSEALRPGSVGSVKPDSIVALSTLTPLLIKNTAVAALAGLLFGFDTAVIAGATQASVHLFNLTPASLRLPVTIALWSTIIGAMVAGIPGDRYGRRDSLRGLAVLFFVSALGCATAWSWLAFVSFSAPIRPQFHLDSSPS